MPHTWMSLGGGGRGCEVCGMSVQRQPDGRFAWFLRPGRAVPVDGRTVSAGQSESLQALPGCVTDQRAVAPEVARPSYGVFIRLAGHDTVLRMTPSGNTTAGDLHAAVFPDKASARRRVEEFQVELDARHPGSEVWTAPL
ncbi:hypothetical protein OU416_09830 [Saccharopolyspora indica]|nr:hypothetical protein [Saccharopolyspora indica]MDA3644355.1 hypothetical protein [Saccharopolyspora indica]